MERGGQSQMGGQGRREEWGVGRPAPGCWRASSGLGSGGQHGWSLDAGRCIAWMCGARAARRCVAVRGRGGAGQPGRGTRLPAWCASPGRWVRLGVGLQGADSPASQLQVSSGGVAGEEGAAHLASGARPTAPPCAKLTRRGKGLPVRGGRSQGPQRPVDVGSRYAGHENGVEVEGAVMGLPSLPAAPLSSFPPSAHPSLEDYI